MDDEELDAAPAEDETVRFTGVVPPIRPDEPPSPTPDRSMTGEIDLQATPKASPVKMPSPIKGPRIVEGVPVESAEVQAAAVSHLTLYAQRSQLLLTM